MLCRNKKRHTQFLIYTNAGMAEFRSLKGKYYERNTKKHTDVPYVMQRGVAIVVLNVGIELALLREVLDHLDVTPEGGLVQRCAARRRLALVHVAVRRDLARALRRAVHRLLAELGRRLRARRARLGRVRRLARRRASERHQLAKRHRKVAKERLLAARATDNETCSQLTLRTRTKAQQRTTNERTKQRYMPACVFFDDRSRRRLAEQRNVGRQHGELAGLLVLVLQRARPLALHPREADEVAVVLVVELERLRRPRTVEARAHLVHAAERVTAAERDDLAIVEAHATKHVAQVLHALQRVRQSTVGGAASTVVVVRSTKVELRAQSGWRGVAWRADEGEIVTSSGVYSNQNERRHGRSERRYRNARATEKLHGDAASNAVQIGVGNLRVRQLNRGKRRQDFFTIFARRSATEINKKRESRTKQAPKTETFEGEK